MFKLLKNFRKKDIIYILISVVLIYLQVKLELEIPFYMAKITKLLQVGNNSINVIMKYGFFMVAFSFISLGLSYFTGYIVAVISTKFSARLRESIFTKVHNLGYGKIKELSISSLITRTTNDVNQVEMLIAMGLQMIIKAPFMAVMIMSRILHKNHVWTNVVICCVAILTFILLIAIFIVLPKFEIIQKLMDKVNTLTREAIKGVRVIRTFNAEKFMIKRFKTVNDDITKANVFTQKAYGALFPVITLLMNGVMIIIYFSGSFLIMNASLANKINLFSDMIVFSTYAVQIIMSYLMLAVIFILLPRAEVSAKRINEVLEKEEERKGGSYKINEGIHTIEFQDVAFKYPDAEENVITGINFKAKKGETIALIGATGSGKSTIINLIPRLFDVTSGRILINGININKYDGEELRDYMAYVSQKAFIFNDTIKNNIMFGKAKNKMKLKEIDEAIEFSKSSDFVDDLDKMIAEGGTNLSGGQKQRLSIARAIARRPDVFIFDDTFSALDYKTDSELRKNLRKYTKDAIMIIVAQRVGTIMNADRILVIESGKCVGIGRHEELLRNCPTYKDIALSQLSREELFNE